MTIHSINRNEIGAQAPVSFSIIIVTYNSEATIVPCLVSVFAALESGVEIVVVDNASRDNTCILLRQLQSLAPCSFRLIENHKNHGFTAATNQGVRASSASTVIFLNPDTVVTPSWLIRLQHHILVNPSVAAVGPVSNFAAGRQSVACHWPGVLPQGIMPEQAAEILSASNSGRYEETRLLIGYCLMVRRELLHQFGGLDERLFLGADDLELSWRLRVYGYRLLIATDCFVYHEGQHSFRSDPASVTGQLVQESSDALYNLLEEHYGVGRVPTPEELWGIDWFKPGTPIYNTTVKIQHLFSLPTGTNLKAPFFSIIILTWNQLAYTKICLHALDRHTPQHHEVIVIDNGSSDGTVEWLQVWKAENPQHKLLLNRENRGFAAGCNQGLALAQGDWLVLLNNDVVVTPGWLNGLLDCHTFTDRAGIVGPLTNNASGIQGIGPAPYKDNETLDQFARRFRSEHRHRRVFSRRLVGFCMLFSRSLYHEIGGLDERFGTGNYEDDDFCLRAAIAGYRNLVAADTYLHHYGSVSFQGGGINYRRTLTGNWALFRDKWTAPVDNRKYAEQISVCRTREEVEKLQLQRSDDQALLLLRQACREFPGDGLLQALYAKSLYAIGQFHDAAKLGHPLAEVRFLVANGLHDEQAEYLLRQAIQADPGCGESCLVLSELVRKRGEHEYADALIVRGFMLSPIDMSDEILNYTSRLTDLTEMRRLVFEAAQLYPDSKPIARLSVLLAATAEQCVAASEKYLLHFGVDHELLAKGLEARKQTGYHQKAKYEIPEVSLCMIVRNEERYLADCLASCRPLVSQILVVDTGSDDQTSRIAQLFGAQVINHTWQNDFSTARNQGLEVATGRWILVMDADEKLSPRDYQLFCQTLEQADGCVFSMTTRNYCSVHGLDTCITLDGSYPEEEAGIGWTPSDKIRLFPNYPGIRFEGLVHELVEGAVARMGLVVQQHPVPIHHYGGLDEERLAHKRRMYYQLGVQKLDIEEKHSAKALYELAVQAGELDQHNQAQKLWLEFLQQEPAFAPAWFNLGYVLLRQGKIQEALSATERALQLKEDYKAARINKLICHFVLYPIQDQMAELLREQSKIPAEPTLLILMAVEHCLNGQLVKGVKDLRQLYRDGIDPTAFILELSRLFSLQDKGETASVLIALSAVIDGGLR